MNRQLRKYDVTATMHEGGNDTRKKNGPGEPPTRPNEPGEPPARL
ncbi:hypothetical protein [Spirosoma fluviale]|nr:hypothetical protein [Spirosoma fluviale]